MANCNECLHGDVCERFTDDVAIICKRFKHDNDYAEVKHGYWKQTEEPLGWQDVTLAECSVCGEGWLTDDNFSIEEFVDYWHYCPNCGAKMDLKEGADNAT